MCKGQSRPNLLSIIDSGTFSVGIKFSYFALTLEWGNTMAVYLPMIFIIILCFAEQPGKVDIRLWLYKLLLSWNARVGFITFNAISIPVT